jgi:cellobiose-specific phosphotransferase system component IIC
VTRRAAPGTASGPRVGGMAATTAPTTGVGRIDVPGAVRGASTGFSILILGGLVAPFWTLLSTAVAAGWLALVAVVAFTVAARHSKQAGNPGVHGAVAALIAYALVLPLILPFEQGRNPAQIGLTVLTAIVVGWLSGKAFARPAQTA